MIPIDEKMWRNSKGNRNIYIKTGAFIFRLSNLFYAFVKSVKDITIGVS